MGTKDSPTQERDRRACPKEMDGIDWRGPEAALLDVLGHCNMKEQSKPWRPRVQWLGHGGGSLVSLLHLGVGHISASEVLVWV